MSAVLVCDGSITIDAGNPVCSGNWSSGLYTLPFDVSQIDPVAAVDAFGSGLIVAGVPFLIIYVGRLVLSTFKITR